MDVIHWYHGLHNMQVYPRPTVVVLSTGDELVEPTTQYVSHGQVVHIFCLDKIVRHGAL